MRELFAAVFGLPTELGLLADRRICRRCLRADPILLGEFIMPILLWHLPLVIFFGSWDVAVSPSEKGSVEAHLDAQSTLETPELSPFGNLAG
jgi:hypothetical protein